MERRRVAKFQLQLLNTENHQIHHVTVKRRKTRPDVLSSRTSEQEQETFIHLGDLFAYMMDNFYIQAQLHPEFPQDVQWIVLSNNTLAILRKWTEENVFDAFEVVQTDEANRQWMRRKPEPAPISDDDAASILASMKHDIVLGLPIGLLQTIVCLAVLPWSPISISVPVMDEDIPRITSLVLPMEWIEFMMTRLSAKLTLSKKKVDIPFLAALLRTEFPPQDNQLAWQLCRNHLLSTGGGVMIRKPLFERLMDWSTSERFARCLASIQKQCSVFLTNVLDFTVPPVTTIQRFDTYLASAYVRMPCRVPHACEWEDIPSLLGTRSLESIFIFMLQCFEESEAEQKKLFRLFRVPDCNAYMPLMPIRHNE